MEFDYSEIYAPLDLDIGHCRMAVAAPADWANQEDPRSWSHLRVATKYPEITRRHFAARGVQAECIKLNGAIELAPLLGLCRHIVDRVSLNPDRLLLSAAEIAAGAERASPETVAALRLAAERIESFHQRQLPSGIDYVDPAGVRLGQRWRPIAAVGLYVPGGTASY